MILFLIGLILGAFIGAWFMWNREIKDRLETETVCDAHFAEWINRPYHAMRRDRW